MALRIVASSPHPGLLTLPWHLPLDQWEGDFVVPLPRGISRHVVRFIRLGDSVYAVKETRESFARGEYRLLRDLRRLGTPAVEPVGVVSGRETVHDEEIEPCLITRHLASSMPYREIFSRGVRPDTMPRLIDALVVLVTRLHLAGFFWGDCSLSNALFRRSAGEFAAYLVDAETGELHDQLSDGQRAHDLDIAVTNCFAEMLDLQAGELMSEDIDAHEIVQGLQERYENLWAELTGAEDFTTDEMWRIEMRIARLNELGFDVDEVDIVTDWDGSTVQIQPKVVDPGHHNRRLQSLTGLDVEENQARRLLNDLDSFAAARGLQNEDPAMVAHTWLTQVFEPIVRMAPPDRRSPVEAAELFHEVLEHRWYVSEQAGREVDTFDAARDYLRNELKVEPGSPDLVPTTPAPTLSPGRARAADSAQ
jgi:tRNA A-37 threonylcarbamoyl transferase component Bud32